MKIKDICTGINDGSHNPPQGISVSKYLMLSSKNIFDNQITLDGPRYLSEEDFEREHKRTKIAAGDVLLTIVGTVGRSAVVGEDMPCFTLQRSVAVLHPKKDVCSSKYLMYALQSKRSYIESRAKGVAQKGIYLKEVSDIELKMIPLSDQQAIVETLDKVATIIRMRNAELQKLDGLIKARFVEMFENGNYVVKKLGTVCKKITDGTHKTPAYLDEGITFISAKNIVNGELDFTDIKHISEEEYQEIQKRCQTAIYDILLSKSGSLGSPVIVKTEEKLGLFESLAVLKYDRERLLPEFLCEQLKTDRIQRQFTTGTKGVAIKHLHLGVIADTDVIVPPLDEQKAFADFVKQVDKSKVAVQKAVDKAQLLFDSLMQRYFG